MRLPAAPQIVILSDVERKTSCFQVRSQTFGAAANLTALQSPRCDQTELVPELRGFERAEPAQNRTLVFRAIVTSPVLTLS